MWKARFALILLMTTSPMLAKSRQFSKLVSIPITVDSDVLMVPVTLNGTVSAHVIFDTGAGLDILAPSLLEKLHAKPAGEFTGFRMTEERLNIPLFVIPELSIGPLVKKDAVVGSFDALDKLNIDGIISANDFRRIPFSLDFANQVLSFETSKSLSRLRARGKSAPLQLDDQREITLDLFANFLIGDQRGQCEIDTGSQGATVSTRYMSRLGIEKDGTDVHKLESRTIAGGTEIRYKARVSRISLAVAPEIHVENPGVSFSDIIYDCNIGTEFWSGKVLTFDLAHRELIVSTPLPH
ncbi:MAG: aspartyl protease family protein [Candidatus Sulfotelmatobacter sp.]